MKETRTQLSGKLFNTKIEIEKELREGNKINQDLYSLIQKTIDFLKAKRKGNPVSKRLLIYKYFENQFGITNLFLIKLSNEARAFYTNTSKDEFKILQIIKTCLI